MAEAQRNKLGKHFARTERRYFIGFIVLVIVLFFTGVTWGMKEDPKEVMAKIRTGLYDVCSVQQQLPKKICDLQDSLLAQHDFSSEIREMQNNKEGAKETLNRHIYIVSVVPSIFQTTIYLCEQKIDGLNQPKHVCGCLAGKLNEAASKVDWYSYETMDTMLAELTSLSKKAEKACLQ
ncbi:MAG: hypothetical protein ACPG05_03350 [Bdellovibrionales bacterium]